MDAVIYLEDDNGNPPAWSGRKHGESTMFSINSLYAKLDEIVLFIDKNNFDINGTISLFAGYTFPCGTNSTIVAVHELWYHLVWDKVFENIACFKRLEWMDNSGGGFRYKVSLVEGNIVIQNSRFDEVHKQDINIFLGQWRVRRDEIISFKHKLYERLVALRGTDVSESLAKAMWAMPPGYLPHELSTI